MSMITATADAWPRPQASGLVAPVLRVEGLGVRYGELVALDQVSWQVAPGELLGIIGPTARARVRATTPSLPWSTGRAP